MESKDWQKTLRILLAGISENQSWLADKLNTTRQDISQKMRAKKFNLEFYNDAVKAIENHPNFKGDVNNSSVAGHTVNHNGVITEEVFRELQKTIREQAELIGMLKEKIRWLEKWASKSK